jgi:hypothetical protein
MHYGSRWLGFVVAILLGASLACSAMPGIGAGRATPVIPSPRPVLTATTSSANENESANANTNANTNENGNLNVNANENANENSNANENGNGNANANDNGSLIFANVPEDVPIINQEVKDLLVTDQVVSFRTDVALADAVAFYKKAMPDNGWTADSATTVELAQVTTLGFKKDNRLAIVTISQDPTSAGSVVVIGLTAP